MSPPRTFKLLFVFIICYLTGFVFTTNLDTGAATGDTSQHTRAKRLTTFGKSPSNPSPPPLVGKGKECKSDKDCEVIQYTTCTVDHRDQRRRCICKDGNPPSNGQCQNRPRERRGYVPFGNRRPETGLREPCRSDVECLEGAECKINPNATTTAQRQTVCICREERMEMNNQCSGSEKSSESVSLVLFGMVALITATRRT